MPKNKPKNNLVILFIGVMLLSMYFDSPLVIVFLILGVKILQSTKNDNLNKFIKDNFNLDLNTLAFVTKGKTATEKMTVENEGAASVTGASSDFGLLANRLLSALSFNKTKGLNKRGKYLQIALNGSLSEARKIVAQLPQSDKIIIEAGTPLIKTEGINVVGSIRAMAPSAYIVADSKVSDNAEQEVLIAARAGAQAVTCLGVATVETIDKFIEACERNKIDSMIDLMNVADPVALLKKLKKLPLVAIIHRGVDETESTKGKSIPYYQINKIKGAYNIMVAIAGGDDNREVESAIFNGANIVVVWKNFMEAGDGVVDMANSFLKEIK